MQTPYRSLLLLLGMVSLLAGIWSGWLKLGWHLPSFQAAWPLVHGPLMVGGFLGTLIGLERAVALKQPWAYGVPALTGLGAVVFLATPLSPWGPLLIALGSLGMGVVFVNILQRQRELFNAVMALGAWLWLVGNALWLFGWAIHQVVYWWMAFLVLTIAGERLELSRLSRLDARSKRTFVVGVAVVCLGLIGTLGLPDLGVRLFGLGLVVLTLWLWRHDLAKRTVRKRGLTRFVAVCMLSGYVWLGLSGVLGLFDGYVVAGPRYDALLHTLFLGFAFSMIFGHAPIIFPGVLGIAVPFRTRFYGHWVLLYATVLLRVAGDLSGGGWGWRWGGLLNGVAILLFLLNTVSSAWQGRQTTLARPS